ncbi:MAG: tetraprenyl-beta-curcumene synthase family protein [Candidatus Eremiobacteraeota bacterium]|nr:tetraprenyl-beta-curcumene synthase family protein [Candidatus Eremiobacteraeota bacterium]
MKDDIRWAVRHVLASPPRLRFLFRGGPSTFLILLRFLREIVPQAASALAEIRAHAEAIPDERLRAEAVASAEYKAYHVAGACILATFLPPALQQRYIAIVAPLETIYDFLDNLCDRHPGVAPAAYPTLHRALADALDPTRPIGDYYADGPNGGDGGYLAWLVARTRAGLADVAGLDALAPLLAEAAAFYSDLQTFKHLPPGEREEACIAWYDRHRERFAQLEWYEFAAASGSQWQVYVPLFLALAGEGEAARAGYDAYFPSVAALHVLLDAFIDEDEDREHGELNLASLYGGDPRMRARFSALADDAEAHFARLPHPDRHRFVLRIMTLFYLTHPKVAAQGMEARAVRLLACIR